MKKIELKHLVGYLPYGLTGFSIRDNYKFFQDIWKVKGYLKDDLLCNRADYINDINISISNFKPILRPLSDLTKEIEVNGEKFVPLHVLNTMDSEYKILFEDDCLMFTDNCNCNLVETSRVMKIYNKLYEWHFDIHGLIKENLAININTLQNEKTI